MKNFGEMLGSLRDTLLPFRAWTGELNKGEVLRADIIAGISVALVLVPQSMAYAQLAGLPPHYGLYASFIPVIIAALFGSSRQLATGPVAVVSLMTATSLEPLASSPETYVAYAILLALMVGVFQLFLGIFRLGVLVDFLSHPVVVGFTNAAAIIIGTSQLGKLFGVSVVKTEHQYETVWNTIVAAAQHTHMATLAMAILALSIMIALKKYAPKVPSVLAAVAITTLVSWLFDYAAAGGSIVGKVPEGLPPLGLPSIDWSVAGQLVTAAITISLIGFMEAISIAKAMAAQTRQRLDPNQELIGQGLGNVASALFSGYAVSGSFSRSAVNISSGARTGYSSVVTGIMVGVTLLFLTPLLYYLPQATLASVIIMAVINLVKIKPIVHAWKAQRHDGIVAVITFVLTLVVAPHLDQGIVVGVLLSLGLFVYRTMRPRIAILSRFFDGTLRDIHVHNLETCESIAVVRFDMSLYFANSGYFETTILQLVADNPGLKYIIVDAQGINQLDATGEEMLHQLVERLHRNGMEMLFGRMKKQFIDTMARTGLLETMGDNRFFARVQGAIEYAWGELGDDHAASCPLNVENVSRRA